MHKRLPERVYNKIVLCFQWYILFNLSIFPSRCLAVAIPFFGFLTENIIIYLLALIYLKMCNNLRIVSSIYIFIKSKKKQC